MPIYGIVTAGLYAIHLINIQHITHHVIVQLVYISVIYPIRDIYTSSPWLYVYVTLIILLLHLDDDCVGNDAYWRSPGVLTFPQTNVSYNKVMLLSL